MVTARTRLGARLVGRVACGLRLAGPPLVIAACAAGAGREPISLDDLARVATPTGARVSPDGSTVLYTLAIRDPARGVEEAVWMVPAAGGEPVWRAAGTAPRWSPDGARIGFLASDSGAPQLWTMAAEPGSPPERLTSLPAGVLDFEWSPDGRWIALAAATPDPATRAVRPQLHLLDPATGAVRQLTRSARWIIVHVWDPGANLSWSPDGTRIAFSEKPSPRFDDDYRSDVYAVAVADGTVTPLVERPGMDQRPLWSPDGRHVAFRTSFGGTHRFRTPHGLGIVAATGGPPSDAGRAFDGGFLDGPYAYAWDPDGDAVFFTGAAPEGTAIFALAVPDGTLERFTPGLGKRALLSIAPAADRMAFVSSDPETPWEVHVSPVSRYEPRRLTRSNPHLDRRVLPDMEIVRWESDGFELAGVLIRPPNAVAPYPLVTYLHGGPEGQAMMAFAPELPSPVFDARFAIHDPQALAARGYAVFIPNFRGSGGRGTALREAALGDWTRIYVADIDAGVASLVRAGIADSARLGLVGSRSGATKVVGLLARASRFRAASILDGHVDLALEYRSSEDFRDYWRQLLGGEPTDPAIAARHSPIMAAAAIATPLQIIAIEGAWETPSEQALTLHAALLERRVPGELILARAPRLADRVELARRVVAWFDRWLARP